MVGRDGMKQEAAFWQSLFSLYCFTDHLSPSIMHAPPVFSKSDELLKNDMFGCPSCPAQKKVGVSRNSTGFL
jgi:hypothetical protein